MSAPRTASGSAAGWSTAGGTAITVGTDDTIGSLSNRYGVPATAILSANGLTAGQVTPGRRLVIPVYSATGTGPAEHRPARVVEAAPSAPAGRVLSSSRIEVKKPEPRIAAAEAPAKTHLRPGRPVVAKAPPPVETKVAAAAPKIDAKHPVKPEARQVAAAKPDPKTARAHAVATEPKPVKVARAEPAKVGPKPVKAAPRPEPAKVAKAEPTKPEPAKVAKAEPPKPVKVARAAEPASRPEPAPKAAASVEAPKAPAREPEATGALPAASAAAAPAETSPGFRWPARGRVISGYGGGGSNEGINIAVPDGTPVKAAGDGVVAYAGSEVKGYGNLVLIRHDNGYVSAYAHNGDLDVKRGQRVTRGQTIAKSGQSGNVTSPQLHFEIRKGSTPVDPMRYLASAN